MAFINSIDKLAAADSNLTSFYTHLNDHGVNGNILAQFEGIYSFVTSQGINYAESVIDCNDEILRVMDRQAKNLDKSEVDPEQFYKIYLLLEYLRLKLKIFTKDKKPDQDQVIAKIGKLRNLGVNMKDSFYTDDIIASIALLESLERTVEIIKLLNLYKSILVFLIDPQMAFYDDNVDSYSDFLEENENIESIEEFNYSVFLSYKKLLYAMISHLQSSIQNPISKALIIHDFGNYVNAVFNNAAADLMLLSRGQDEFVALKNLNLNQLIDFNKQLLQGIGRMIDLLYIFEKDTTNRELPPDAYNRAVLSTLGNVTRIKRPIIPNTERFELEYYEVLLQGKLINIEFIYKDIGAISEIYKFELVKKFGWVLRTILQNMCKFEASNIRAVFSVEEDVFVVRIFDDIQSDNEDVSYINSKIREQVEKLPDGTVKGTGGLKLSSNLISEFGGTMKCQQVEDGIYTKFFEMRIPRIA